MLNRLPLIALVGNALAWAMLAGIGAGQSEGGIAILLLGVAIADLMAAAFALVVSDKELKA